MGELAHQRWLRQLIRQPCEACSLAATRHSMVIYRGNPRARVLCLGEAPGYHEDLKGRPFTGHSGTLLVGMLTEAGFEVEEDLYICNAVKCRPPQNRDPLPEELAACRPLLLAQLSLVKPRLILTFGRIPAIALGLLGPDEPLRQVVGQWGVWENIRVRFMYHPAYILRRNDKQVEQLHWLRETVQVARRERLLLSERA